MQNLNLELQLVVFIERFKTAPKVRPQHVALYCNLLMRWRKQKRSPVIHITSQELMTECKIGSRKTYFRYMKELVAMGFIIQYGKRSGGAYVIMKNFLPDV